MDNTEPRTGERVRVIEQVMDLTLAVVGAPVLFAFDCWCFGTWKTIFETRPGRWVEDKFWDTFGWQPNGPPPK